VIALKHLTSSILVLVIGPACAAPPAEQPAADPAQHVHVTPDSDARAIEVAQDTVDKMGGWDSWDRTRYLSWKFFGGRRHHWDRLTGDVRIEGAMGENKDRYLWLMNVETRAGRVWKNGEEITESAALAEALDLGRQVWVNDSYWLVMPYKLLDPGVTLKYAGERPMADGRVADVLTLTFGDGVGYTPENRYEVFVAKDTGLVEQWSFFAKADDAKPGFTLPWSGWQQFGDIKLATGKGRDADWAIVVSRERPEGVFDDPRPATE